MSRLAGGGGGLRRSLKVIYSGIGGFKAEIKINYV